MLHCFGFGERFLALLLTLYDAPMASLMLRGYSPQPLDIRRGTRQRCPLSLLLFALAMEPLAIKICACPDVRGIVCGDREHKCLLFADDLLLALSSSITSLPNLYANLQPFLEISGLKINYDKSRALNLSLQSSIQRVLKQSYQFQWEPETLLYLGIRLTQSIQTLYKHNYPALFKRLTEDLARWQIHPPSWFGRLHSIKLNILPRVLYLFRTIPVSLVRFDLLLFQKRFFSFYGGTRGPG